MPNGSEPGSEKYAYKLAWLARLQSYLQARNPAAAPLVLCGDINIAPEVRDVARPEAWEGTVLFNSEMSDRFGALLATGLVDTLRLHHAEAGLYSWWDYRRLGFPRNDGLRIDHVLASEPLAKRCTEAFIDREERKGEKPSDHAPVVVTFERP